MSSVPSSILDERLFLYQNPRTGTVSSNPMSLRQLIKLCCPPREGLPPILPSTTQCLPVNVTMMTTTMLATESADTNNSIHEPQLPNVASFGEWTALSEIDVLREASCNEWYWTMSGSSETTTNGPGSCRMLLNAALSQQQPSMDKIQNFPESPTITIAPGVLVFAKNVTPEWTDMTKLESLQLVLNVLQHTNSNSDNENAIAESSKVASYSGYTLLQPESQNVQDELEAFLMSTADGMTSRNKRGVFSEDEDGNDDHTYESDGGTQYIKDPMSGNWIHEALAPPEARARLGGKDASSSDNNNAVNTSASSNPPKKKSNKSKFSKRNAKHWIYISGLPTDNVTADDLQHYFSKAGLLDLDPETLHPKIKLYKDHTTGKLKGDASICYARPESVELALQVLDDSLWDKDHRIRVERARFEAKSSNNNQNGEGNNNHDINNKRKRPVSQAQRKVARLALLQAQDDGFGGRLAGGRKGLRIVVIKNMMEGIPENQLEDVLRESLEDFGCVEKITCITKTKVVIVKFVEPMAASEALEALNGRINPTTDEKMEAIYWDGVTDYTTANDEEEVELQEEARRHEDFGSWLESQQELPPELCLQVAEED
jgi:HIV Tat-specific factor 1